MDNKIKTLYWDKETLYLLDQRFLPNRVEYRSCRNYLETISAIKEMSVRGAPAIGISAAYGMAVAAREALQKDFNTVQMLSYLEQAASELIKARPTAVNLFWAVKRIEIILQDHLESKPEEIYSIILKEAQQIHKEDIENNRLIGMHGNKLIPERASILTHCNAGALATGGYGTALGVIRTAFENGKDIHVYVDETRPLLQGARITAFELCQEKIPATLITDNSAAFLMSRGDVDLIIVGADRVAANGDVANKIGTYNLAILATYHDLPFYVAAPISTIDPEIGSGSDIIIEERSGSEITGIGENLIAPKDIEVTNYAFDITPASLITAIITEKGIISKPGYRELKKLL